MNRTKTTDRRRITEHFTGFFITIIMLLTSDSFTEVFSMTKMQGVNRNRSLMMSESASMPCDFMNMTGIKINIVNADIRRYSFLQYS